MPRSKERVPLGDLRRVTVIIDRDVHHPERTSILFKREEDGWYVKTDAVDDWRPFAQPEARERDVRQLIKKKWSARFGDPDPLDDLPLNYPDLPEGWSWWSGDRSDSHYTRWFGTDYRMGGPHAGRGNRLGGYEGEVYHDEGSDHHVAIYPVIGVENDDPVIDYAEVSRSFDTEKEAIEAVPKLIHSLGD